MKPYLRPHPGIEKDFDVLVVDTEFSRLPWPKEGIWSWAEHCQVLAVGIVPLDSKDDGAGSFYAVRRIDKLLLSQCNQFVQDTVIPRLLDAPPAVVFANLPELGAAMEAYLAERKARTGKEALLAVDWLGDAYLLAPLSQHDHDWLLVEGVAQIERALGDDWPEGQSRHNALHDAQAIKTGLQHYLRDAAKG